MPGTGSREDSPSERAPTVNEADRADRTGLRQTGTLALLFNLEAHGCPSPPAPGSCPCFSPPSNLCPLLLEPLDRQLCPPLTGDTSARTASSGHPDRKGGLRGPGPALPRRHVAQVPRGRGTWGLSTRPSGHGQAVTQGCSWALRGRRRSGSKFTGQATHTAHQGLWTVPGDSAAPALGPDSEHSTIWPPSGRMRGGKE